MHVGLLCLFEQQTSNLGTLMGQVIKGDIANIIKHSFLELVSQADNNRSNVYEMPIEMSSQMAEWLQLDDVSGKISLARLKNGIMGYCPQEGNDGKAFVFVANCDEFNDKKPNSTSTSELQVYKMMYSHECNQRILVNLGGTFNGSPQCKYRTPPIVPNENTVQQVLDLIEYAMRHATLDNMKCYDYPQFCLQEYQNNVTNGKGIHNTLRDAGVVWGQTIKITPGSSDAAPRAVSSRRTRSTLCSGGGVRRQE